MQVLGERPVTKLLRITSHDRVKHDIATLVRSKRSSVCGEITLRTLDCVFRPDMIAIPDDRVLGVNTQITGKSTALHDAHVRKVRNTDYGGENK